MFTMFQVKYRKELLKIRDPEAQAFHALIHGHDSGTFKLVSTMNLKVRLLQSSYLINWICEYVSYSTNEENPILNLEHR